MPTRLQQARYDGLLRRVGDLKGGGAKVSEVLGEVFPVLSLENLPAELYLLAGWQLGFGSSLMFATAAQVNIIQLFNPVDSGQIIVPTRIILSSDAGQRIEYDVDSGPLATLVSSSVPRDTRRGVRVSLAGEVRQVTQVGSLAAIGQFFLDGQNQTFDFRDLDGLFVLGPGTGLNIGTTNFNTTLMVTFHWRERLAEPSELNF